jgi:hypothetical protein
MKKSTKKEMKKEKKLSRRESAKRKKAEASHFFLVREAKTKKH